MSKCAKCNKAFTVGTTILVPLTSAYKDSENGTKKEEVCLPCFKKL